jgi:hypothetical protein
MVSGRPYSACRSHVVRPVPSTVARAAPSSIAMTATRRAHRPRDERELALE